MSYKSGNENVLVSEGGQAAVEVIFVAMVLVLFILASAQLLYTTMISSEAVKRVHKGVISVVREANDMVDHVALELVEEKMEVPVTGTYGRVVNGWSLFYRDNMVAHSDYGRGSVYTSERGVHVVVGPLKEVGRSAFGVPKGNLSDGDGHNTSGRALRVEYLDELCAELDITAYCNYRP